MYNHGEGPSRGLLSDCTTGCGTDGSFYSTIARLKREEEEEGDVVDGVWSWVRRFRSVRSIHFSDDIMLKLAGPDSVQYLR